MRRELALVARLYRTLCESMPSAATLSENLFSARGATTQVAEAIAWHHEPTLAPRFPDMARMVRLADRIAHFTAPGTLEAPPSEAELRADESLVALNVYPDQLDALLAMKDRALQVTEGMA